MCDYNFRPWFSTFPNNHLKSSSAFHRCFRAIVKDKKTNMFSSKDTAHKQINLLLWGERMEKLNMNNPIPSLVIFVLLILQTIENSVCYPSRGITLDTFILSPFIHTHTNMHTQTQCVCVCVCLCGGGVERLLIFLIR